MVGTGSRKVSALVLNDLLKYIVQDGFGVVRVFHVLRDPQDVAALANVVLNVVVVAFVGELGHFDSARGQSRLANKRAVTYFSDANCSSRSNKSSEGGGRSLMLGRKTAAYSYGIGVSNWGGIRVSGSCLIPKVP